MTTNSPNTEVSSSVYVPKVGDEVIVKSYANPSFGSFQGGIGIVTVVMESFCEITFKVHGTMFPIPFDVILPLTIHNIEKYVYNTVSRKALEQELLRLLKAKQTSPS